MYAKANLPKTIDHFWNQFVTRCLSLITKAFQNRVTASDAAPSRRCHVPALRHWPVHGRPLRLLTPRHLIPRSVFEAGERASSEVQPEDRTPIKRFELTSILTPPHWWGEAGARGRYCEAPSERFKSARSIRPWPRSNPIWRCRVLSDRHSSRPRLPINKGIASDRVTSCRLRRGVRAEKAREGVIVSGVLFCASGRARGGRRAAGGKRDLLYSKQ
ncbi:hypothetical protein EVAR_82603_1 [Eumeta japonica]|uniref:Uncharacterized protein n=1 Tax=Eumeta variegata TaxID=151549 RepID=A0A4C1X2L7_EUMVA|nr:hypothetical protein EVAR_82603_1 [Eumeta japonica]